MLTDNVYVVTGAGHGIGRAAAVELGRRGATVVANDLGTTADGEGSSPEPVNETARAVREAGGEATAHFGDVASMAYTESLVEDTVEEYGRVDGAANFAGILDDAILHKMTADQWDKVVRVHLRGHFALLRALAAHWRTTDPDRDSQRSFLTVSSRSALGSVGQANYSAAKAGILGLTRTAARELDRYDVRVNALMPSAYTRMTETIPEEKRPDPEDKPSEESIAPVVAYLLSDHASDVTGCTIRAAGGTLGVYTDPELVRVGFDEDGWELEDIVERFQDTVAHGVDLDRSDDAY